MKTTDETLSRRAFIAGTVAVGATIALSSELAAAADGKPLTSRVEALEAPGASNTPYILPPPGTTDASSAAMGTGKDAGREIKEWQAIMDHLSALPARKKGELPAIPVDERAAEIRAIKIG